MKTGPDTVSADCKSYRAKIVEVSEYNQSILICYDGSKEEFRVEPYMLILLPAGK